MDNRTWNPASKIRLNYVPEVSALILGRAKPAMVTVNLTDRCNQRCIYCELSVNPPSQERKTLTAADLEWIIDEMAENQISRLSLCGGEPFLFGDLFRIVDYAGKKQVRCTITTNGMTAHRMDKEELKILRDHKTLINLSVDSFRNDINSFTRGTEPALANALRSIEVLSANGIPVTVLTAISKYNYQGLYDLTVEACNRGIRQVLFQPVIHSSNYPEKSPLEQKAHLNVSYEDIDRLMEELKQILHFERTHPIETNVYRILPWIRHYLEKAADRNGEWFFDKVLNKFYCREIYAIIDISYYGDIQPCGLAPASVSIHQNRERGLIQLWKDATIEIADDLEHGRYRDYCNACCHHFSRNMLASVLKFPFQNRLTALNLSLLLFSRAYSRTIKHFTLKH